MILVNCGLLLFKNELSTDEAQLSPVNQTSSTATAGLTKAPLVRSGLLQSASNDESKQIPENLDQPAMQASALIEGDEASEASQLEGEQEVTTSPLNDNDSEVQMVVDDQTDAPPTLVLKALNENDDEQIDIESDGDLIIAYLDKDENRAAKFILILGDEPDLDSFKS